MLDSFAWGWFKVRSKKRRSEVQFKACIKEDEAERESEKKQSIRVERNMAGCCVRDLKRRKNAKTKKLFGGSVS